MDQCRRGQKINSSCGRSTFSPRATKSPPHQPAEWGAPLRLIGIRARGPTLCLTSRAPSSGGGNPRYQNQSRTAIIQRAHFMSPTSVRTLRSDKLLQTAILQYTATAFKDASPSAAKPGRPILVSNATGFAPRSINAHSLPRRASSPMRIQPFTRLPSPRISKGLESFSKAWFVISRGLGDDD